MRSYSKIINQFVTIGMMLFAFLLFTNYMFLSPDMRMRQRGLFPIVKYKTGDLLPHLSLIGFEPLKSVRKAADVWFDPLLTRRHDRSMQFQIGSRQNRTTEWFTHE